MNVSCDIIRDLLPLYAENLVSGDSRRLVEGHLGACSACRQEYEKLKAPLPADGALPLKKLKRHLLRKRVETALCAAALVFAGLTAAFAWLSAPDYVPYSSGAAVCVAEPDGVVKVTFRSDIAQYGVEHRTDQAGKESVVLLGWNTELGRIFHGPAAASRTILLEPRKGAVASVWYCTPGNDDTLLWGTDAGASSGGTRTLPRLALSYYACFALILFAVGCALFLVFRKSSKLRNILQKVVFVPASYLIGHLCVKGFNCASYSMARDLSLIALVGVFAYCALLFGSSVLKRVRRSHEKAA